MIDDRFQAIGNCPLSLFLHLLVLIPLFFFLSSCEKEKITAPPSSGGVYIINEGNFNFGNAEVSVYNPESKQVNNNQFQAANGYSLGDVAQSMFVKDSFGFIVVNNSSKIEVVKLPSLQKIRTIIIPNSSPRYFLAINDSIAYVSELYANKVHVVNYIKGTLVTQISVPQYTERLVQVDEYVFAEGKKIFANSSAKGALIRLRISDHSFVDKREFTGDVNGIVKDSANHIVVLVGRDTATLTTAALHWFDKNMTLLHTYSFDTLNESPSLLSYSPADARLWYVVGEYVYGMDEGSLQAWAYIHATGSNIYALGIDPKNGEVYVSDALDYVQPSHILRYHKNGTLIHSFTAGVIAGNFAFNDE